MGRANKCDGSQYSDACAGFIRTATLHSVARVIPEHMSSDFEGPFLEAPVHRKKGYITM